MKLIIFTEKLLDFLLPRYQQEILFLVVFCIWFSKYNLTFTVICEVSFASGDDGIRTRDPLLARQVLSQLSYAPSLLS